MTLIAQPAYNILPAYRPVKFLLSYLSGFGIIIENALVKIRKNGVAIGEPIIIKSSSQDSISFPGLITYYFEVDIQKYCQDLLSPFEEFPSIFPSASQPYSIDSKFYSLFNIEVSYQAINPTTGLLVDAPGFDESNEFYVYTAARQHQANQEQYLLDYTGLMGIMQARRISKSTNPINISSLDNQYISLIQDDILALNGLRVLFFDKNNVFLGFGYASTGAPLGSAQFTINIGLEGLSNLSYTFGGVPIGEIGRYEIDFGYLTGASTMIVRTPTYNYTINDNYCVKKSIRFHWMNSLGGSDSYTFKYDKDLILTTNFSIGEKALNWAIGSSTPHNINDVGGFKLKSEGFTSYNVSTGILSNSDAEWIVEILTSPKVYAEIEGEFVPVIIEKTNQSISREEGKIRISITAILANDLIIQRI